MFNRQFLSDLAERAIATAIQAWAAAFAVPGPDVMDSVKIGLVAALVSAAKSISARKIGDDSASLARVYES